MRGFLAHHRRGLALTGVLLLAFVASRRMAPAAPAAPSLAERLNGPSPLLEPVAADASVEVAVRVPTRTVASAKRYEVVEVAQGGTIRGTVRFDQKPEVWTIARDKDGHACGEAAAATERVVFDPETLAVANCVVFLADVKKGKAWTGAFAKDIDDRVALLDQKGCVYRPHVLLVRTETTVRVPNSDPAVHNVKGQRDGSAAFNKMTSIGSTGETVFIEKPGAYDLACSIHNWMSGTIWSSLHPYVVVTGKDGAFELTNIPPGTYTLVCWHEGMDETPIHGGGKITGYAYGPPVQQSQKVDVAADGTATIDFEIPAPKKAR